MFPFDSTIMNNYMGEMYSSVNNMPASFFCVPNEWVGIGNVAPQPRPLQQNSCILPVIEQSCKKETPTTSNTNPSKPKTAKKEDPEVFVWSGE